jgi:hypothetical protein|tara:strand:- start:64 stop:291 length:228 start_codon:yes stop_codon:yes gene_type:complete
MDLLNRPSHLEIYRCRIIATIRRIHETINAVPPIGVIAPNQRVDVRLRAYKLPENMTIPENINQPANLMRSCAGN